MAKKSGVKATVKYGKSAPSKKMLGSAKSPHKVGVAPKKVKKIKESAGVTFGEKRRELLAAMLEGIIDGDDVAAAQALKEYFPLKTHQIIMEKEDDDEIEEQPVEKEEPEMDDEEHEDAEADEEGDHEEPDGDEDEDGEEPESEEEGEPDEDEEPEEKEEKLFKR